MTGIVLPWHSMHTGWSYVIHMAAHTLVDKFGIPSGFVEGRAQLRRKLQLHPNDFDAMLDEFRVSRRYDFAVVYAGNYYVRVERWN